MSKILLKLLLVLLAVLSLIVFTACDSKLSEPQLVGYSQDLTLEQARQQLEEKGGVFMGSAAMASQLVDFPLVEPSYIPKGFGYQRIFVSKLGVGVPNPPEPPVYTVEIYYTQRNDFRLPDQYWFSLVQDKNSDLTPSGIKELITLCGRTVTKVYTPEDEINNALPRLYLSWQEDSASCLLLGLMGDLLDESAMEKIACSIINQ